MTCAMSITVLIPAYQAQSTIDRALESVFAQSLLPDQILIVDDGSPEPLRVAQADQKPLPLKVLRLDRNLGSSGALNHGIAHVTTTWIAFLDADDSWHRHKLAQQMACAAAHPESALIATGLRFIGAQGETLADVATTTLPEDATARFAALLEDCVIGKPSVLARTDVLRALGCFSAAHVVGEDQHMWLRIAALHRVDIVPDILTFAHDTPGSLSKRTDVPAGYLWIDVIEPLLEQHRHRFSPEQLRRIIGVRSQQAAIAHLARGSYRQALRYLWQSACQGHDWLQNLSYALTPLKKWR
jgi:glycosyltransferase involved in cell wall biosynthesis